MSTLSVCGSVLACTVVGCLVIGCGTSSTPVGVAANQQCIADSTGSVSLPLLLTSDAPTGQATAADMGINSIIFTDACGKTATAFTAPPENVVGGIGSIEFTHLTGVSEPLAIATIPSAVYTSVEVLYSVVNLGYRDPTTSNQWDDASVLTNPASAKVELQAPIDATKTGNAVVIDTLLASPFDITSVSSLSSPDATFTPVFQVSSFAIETQPTNDRNGTAHIYGLTKSAAGNELNMYNSAGLPLSISVLPTTVFQGISGLSALSAHVPVDVDVQLQEDGTLQASRIQADDPNAGGAWMGPFVQTYSTEQYQYIVPRLWQQSSDVPSFSNPYPWQFQFTTNTLYQRSGETIDLSDLPFAPRFESYGDVALGQELSISWLTMQTYSTQPQTEATVTTLLPRAVSGTVASKTVAANYTMYTVQLADHDLLTSIAGTDTIAAYTNAGTRMEDGALSLGDSVNMHGYLYNDSGTLRLVCDQTRLQKTP